ncbi:MAG: hypothetical protein CM15mP102_01070 [Flavobacteriales bacterium]|nr:MAG: hypothetical protein CM15mP102_01070 [Flavobacteriales bacterium]
MQKFDDEPSMEFKNINRAYDSIRLNHDENLLKSGEMVVQVYQ